MTFVYCCASDDRGDAYRLLEYAVKEVYGIGLPDIERLPSGKPRFASRPDIFFSISHTKSHVLCAVGDVPCGCDIELRRPVREKLPARVCTEEELAAFDFFTLWTLKESFIKISGVAPEDFRDIVFSKEGDTVVAPAPGFSAAVYDVPGCASAVICEGAPPDKLIFVSRENLS